MGSKNKTYSGMTLNEMLFKAGSLELFDEAVKKRDRAALLEILNKVDVDKENGEKIIQAIFDDPKKFGY